MEDSAFFFCSEVCEKEGHRILVIKVCQWVWGSSLGCERGEAGVWMDGWMEEHTVGGAGVFAHDAAQ